VGCQISQLSIFQTVMLNVYLSVSSTLTDIKPRDSIVGTVTHYGLDGLEIDPDGGEIFLTCPDQQWGSPASYILGTRSFLG
jgi:hypothetical protein